MNKVASYFKESYKELMEKVTWPNWDQLQQSTVIVLVATLIVTAVIFVMDFASKALMDNIYKLF